VELQGRLTIVYYLRAKALGVKDRLLDLCIGVAYLSRAMQRQANNRHKMILQGMTFLTEYYRAEYSFAETLSRAEAVERRVVAEYNMGRAFHQLGLTSYAVHYYEKVIELEGRMDERRERTGLLFEAVHNLSLIYCSSGNYAAAKEITERYLVL
jgi:general transcription factor 3C polypeptide 3 (transcription factor C subunit 4)